MTDTEMWELMGVYFFTMFMTLAVAFMLGLV